MKIRNTTNETRQTWQGQGVNAGDVLDAGSLPANEVDWLLRHGFEKVGKPKAAPVASDSSSTPPVYVPRRKRLSRKG